jgi:hypothetical protein
MVLLTITKWRRKLALTLIGALILAVLGLSINTFMAPAQNPAIAPTGNLESDVLSSPEKVQGEADINLIETNTFNELTP